MKLKILIILTLLLVIVPSSAYADTYGTGLYGQCLYGKGCTPEPGGWGGYHPPLNFTISPNFFIRVLNPGSEYEENITVFNATTYDTIIAEVVCSDDNSCNWFRFIIDGIVTDLRSIMFNINEDENKTLDFAVSMPIESDNIEYDFNITFSNIDGETVKSSNYKIGTNEFLWFNWFYGLSVIGGITGGVFVWVGIVSVFIVFLVIIVQRKKKGVPIGSEYDEEELEEET